MSVDAAVAKVAQRGFSWAAQPAQSQPGAATPATPAKPASSPQQDLASQALADMKDAFQRSPDEALQVGMKYGQQMATGDFDTIGRTAAQTTLNCVASLQQVPQDTKSPKQDSNTIPSVVALRSCFHTIAAATGAPIGATLAQVGAFSLTAQDLGKYMSAKHAVLIGQTYGKAVVDAPDADPNEKLVAQRSLDVADKIAERSHNPKLDHTLGKLMRSCLTTLGAGIASAPIAKTLAQVGVMAMYDSDIQITADEADLVGLGFTHAIKDNATDPTERDAAAAAITAYNREASSGDPNAAGQGAHILGEFLKAAATDEDGFKLSKVPQAPAKA